MGVPGLSVKLNPVPEGRVFKAYAPEAHFVDVKAFVEAAELQDRINVVEPAFHLDICRVFEMGNF